MDVTNQPYWKKSQRQFRFPYNVPDEKKKLFIYSNMKSRIFSGLFEILTKTCMSKEDESYKQKSWLVFVRNA